MTASRPPRGFRGRAATLLVLVAMTASGCTFELPDNHRDPEPIVSVKGTPQEIADKMKGPVLTGGQALLGVPFIGAELDGTGPGWTSPVDPESVAGATVDYSTDPSNPDDAGTQTIVVETIPPDSPAERALSGRMTGAPTLVAANGRWKVWENTAGGYHVDYRGTLGAVNFQGGLDTSKEATVRRLLDQLRLIRPR